MIDRRKEMDMVSEHIKVGTEANFDELVKEGVSAVDFWAEWCGPCHMLTPIIEQFAAAHQGELTVVKVNVDENPSLAARFAIHGIPTVVFFKDGKEVERLVGVRPPQEFEAVFSRVR